VPKLVEGDEKKESSRADSLDRDRSRNGAEDDLPRRNAPALKDREKNGWATPKAGRAQETKIGTIDRERVGLGRNSNRNDRNGIIEDETEKRGLAGRTNMRGGRDADMGRMGRFTGREGGGWRNRERAQVTVEPDHEQDPEWLDEPLEPAERPVAKTVDDFEKWRARMKGQPIAIENKEAESRPEVVQEIQKPVTNSLLSDATFGTWNTQEKADTSSIMPEVKPNTSAPNKKASRFASMFTPKEDVQVFKTQESTANIPTPPLPPSEDQAGFSRMLMKLRASNTGPQSDGVATENSSNNGLAALFGAPNTSPKLNERDQFFSPPENPSNNHSRDISLNGPPPPPNRMLSSMSNSSLDQKPNKPLSLSKDSEFLLNLIQAKSTSANATPQSKDVGAAELFPPFMQAPAGLVSADRPPKRFPPGFENVPRPSASLEDGNGDNHHQNRRSVTQPPPGFFTDPHMSPPPRFNPPVPRMAQDGRPIGLPDDMFVRFPQDHQLPQSDRIMPGPPPGFYPPPGFPNHLPPSLPLQFANLNNQFPPDMPRDQQPQQQHRQGPPGLPPLPRPPNNNDVPFGMYQYNNNNSERFTNGPPPGFGPGPPFGNMNGPMSMNINGPPMPPMPPGHMLQQQMNRGINNNSMPPFMQQNNGFNGPQGQRMV